MADTLQPPGHGLPPTPVAARDVTELYHNDVGNANLRLDPLDEYAEDGVRFRDVILDSIPFVPGGRILDVGCDDGRQLLRYVDLHGFDGTAIGLDINAKAIDLANDFHLPRAQNPAGATISFQHGSMESLPFDDESFDVVENSFGYHHSKDLAAALLEAHRVLKIGGVHIVAVNGLDQKQEHSKFLNACWHYLTYIKHANIDEFHRFAEAFNIDSADLLLGLMYEIDADHTYHQQGDVVFPGTAEGIQTFEASIRSYMPFFKPAIKDQEIRDELINLVVRPTIEDLINIYGEIRDNLNRKVYYCRKLGELTVAEQDTVKKMVAQTLATHVTVE